MWKWIGVLLPALLHASSCPNNGRNNMTAVPLDLQGYFSEVSGTAVSTQTFNGQRLVWVHDDSGGIKALGLYNAVTGQQIHRFYLPDSVNWEDPEDMALGDCGASWPVAGTGECIYIAEAGDNNAASRSTPPTIIKLREPTISPSINVGGRTNLTMDGIQILKFFYPLGVGPTNRTDCETVFVDSTGTGAGEEKGDIYLVSKWRLSADYDKIRIYRYPNSAQDNTTNFPLELGSNSTTIRDDTWTRGDLSRDGSLFVLGSYGITKFWLRTPGTRLRDLWNLGNECGSSLTPPSLIQPQQEAAALTPQAPFILVEIGECLASPCNASLYITPLVAPPSPATPPPTAVSGATWHGISAFAIGLQFVL